MLRSVFAAGAAVGIVRFAGAALGLLVTVVLGRMLGPEGLGVYGYVVICLTLLAIPVSNGWATLILRRVAGATHDGHWAEPRGLMLRGTLLAAFLAAGILALGVVLRAVIPEHMPSILSFGLLLLLAAVLFFDQLSALRLAVLRGLNYPVWGQIPEMLLRPALIAGFFLLIAALTGRATELKHAFWALLAASTISMAAGTLVMQRKSPAALKEVQPTYDTRAWMRSAALLSGNAGLVMLNSYIDVLMLGVLSSFEQVGVYRVALQIAFFSGFVYVALNTLAGQRFAYLGASGDLASLQSVAVFMARLSLLGTLPLPLIFLFFGEHILGGVFGPGFIPALGPLLILFLGQVVNASAGMSRTMLIMRGREARVIRFTLSAVFLNLVLCVILIPSLGTIGAALSTLISVGLWNVTIWVYALRSLGIDTSVIGLSRPPPGHA